MISVNKLSKKDELYKYSDPIQAQLNALNYLGDNSILFKSNNKNKKYAIVSPSGKIINFGQLGYEDYLKHKNDLRCINYLNRAKNIKGEWKDNVYSPNNLSRYILWSL